MRHRLFWAVGIASAFCALILLPTAAAGAQGGGQPVCADCHEEAVRAIAPTKHGAKLDATTTLCQSCHGDVAAHLEDPTVKPAHSFDRGMKA